jgi:CCR4-NOT transcription complex subunit 9
MEESNLKDMSSEISKDMINSSNQDEVNKIIEWVNQIKVESTREQALAELSRKRESFQDLALFIWYSPGVVSGL